MRPRERSSPFRSSARALLCDEGFNVYVLAGFFVFDGGKFAICMCITYSGLSLLYVCSDLKGELDDFGGA